MPGGLSSGGVLGLLKTPWMGLVVIALFVGGDHATISNKLDGKADTVAVVLLKHELREQSVKLDTVIARQQRVLCYLVHNAGPECAK